MENPSQLKRLPDSSCNMKCSGNPKYSCGGYLTINVFWTGIQSKEVKIDIFIAYIFIIACNNVDF